MGKIIRKTFFVGLRELTNLHAMCSNEIIELYEGGPKYT